MSGAELIRLTLIKLVSIVIRDSKEEVYHIDIFIDTNFLSSYVHSCLPSVFIVRIVISLPSSSSQVTPSSWRETPDIYPCGLIRAFRDTVHDLLLELKSSSNSLPKL